MQTLSNIRKEYVTEILTFSVTVQQTLPAEIIIYKYLSPHCMTIFEKKKCCKAKNSKYCNTYEKYLFPAIILLCTVLEAHNTSVDSCNNYVIYICTALTHCIFITMFSVSLTYFCEGPMEYKYIQILTPRTAFIQIQSNIFS